METALTERELSILRLIASGASNGEIARGLHLTEGTVKWYNRQIFAKLGARNRVEAIRALGDVEEPNLAQASASSRATRAHVASENIMGRDAELAEALSLLRAHRLVTILAPGGMGKSTLARAIAEAANGEFPNGACHVALSPLESADDIPAAIASASGITIGPGLPVMDQVLHHCRDWETLLVLDNFERLIDGALVVRQLLDAAPRLSVLATSRERLGLHDEALMRLGGLPVPPEGGSADNAAIRLFARHAQRVSPGFRLDAPTLTSVARICRLAEGMPLAIILAATWTGALSVREIASEMSRGIDILATRLRDVPSRHRSMQNVIDQTWERLSPGAQRVFAELSVFRGGFTRAAATAVTSVTSETLQTLIEHALIRREDDRYSIHELLRQYAARKLTDSGREAHVAARHHAYYLSWLVDSIREPTETELDFENLRRAWEHAVTVADEPAVGLGLVALIRFCESTGRLSDLARLCDFSSEGGMSRALRGRLLLAGAMARTEVGDFSRAVECYSEAERVAQDDGDTQMELRALIGGADALNRARKLEQATALATRARGLAQAVGDSEAEADAHFHLGRALWYGGREPQALETMTRAVDLAKASRGSGRVAIQALNGMGAVCATSGRISESAACFQQALTLARELGQLSIEAEIIEMQGWLLLDSGAPDQSQALFSTAVEIAKRAGLLWVATAATSGLALSCALLGDFARAYVLANDGLRLTERVGVAAHRAHCLHALATIYGHLGMPAMAEAARNTAYQILCVQGPAWLVEIQGRLAVDRVETDGDIASARHFAESALERATTNGQYGLLPHAADAVCQVSAAAGDWSRLLGVAQEALVFCKSRDLTGHIAILEGHRGAAQLALGDTAAAIQSLQTALPHAETHGLVRTQIDLHRTFKRACAATGNAIGAALHHARASDLIAQIRQNIRDIPELAAGMNI